MYDGSHSLHTLGTADTAGDVPQAVRTNTANAEARAVVERLLGLRMPQINTSQEVIVRRIEDRVFSIVDQARSSIGRDALRSALDNNLSNALRQIRPQLAYADATENERVQAVAQAVYESLPSDVMYQVALQSAPVNVAIENGVPTSVVRLPGIAILGRTIDVEIDMNHPFWKQNEFRGVGDIAAAMDGLNGSDVGIRNANLRNHPLTRADIRRLLAGGVDGVSIPSVNIPDSGAVGLEIPPGSATPTNFSIRMDALFRGVTTSDAPPRLQNRNIAELNPNEIRILLEHPGAAGNFPYWRQYVNCGPHPPTLTGTSVAGAPAAYAAQQLSVIAEAEIIRNRLAAGRPIGSLQNRRARFGLIDAHAEMRVEQTRAQALLDNLTNGSENTAGAAVALALARSDRRILDVVTQQGNEPAIRTNLNRARAQLQLSSELTRLGELSIAYRFPTIPNPAGGTTPATYDDLMTQRTLLAADIQVVASPVVTTPWTSAFTRTAGLGSPNSYATDPNAATALRTSLNQQLREIDEELRRYESLTLILERVTQFAVAADLYNASPALQAQMTAASVRVPGQLNAATNPVALAELIRNQTRLDTNANIEAQITRIEAQLRAAQAGGDRGDVLQQRIFQEHFRRQGLSTAEAEKSANYLYARSLLDDELTTQHQVLINDLFDAVDHGPEDRKLENRGRNTLRHLTATMGINAQNNNAEPYDWESASYRQLVTAYFAMKRVYEGTAGQSISAPGSHAVQNQMRRVAEVMSRRHAQMILNDMGNNLSEEDRRNLGSRKALTTETFEKFLTGDAPAKYQPRIDAVLHATEGRVYRSSFWGSRTGRILSGTGRIAKAGGGVALYAGAKTFGAANTAKNLAWSQRKNIATLALFTALGGPLGVAAWGGMKMMEGGNTPAAASGH